MYRIYNRWPQWFRDRLGGEWPRDYCYVDTETTGFDRQRDVVWEWSHVLVQDCQIVDQLQLIIDWTNHHIVPDAWLRKRINTLRQGMEMQGRISQLSYERMQDEGVKPEKALEFINDFTSSLKARGVPFAAHGGIFDEEMLDNLIEGGFSFGDDGWLDTECLEKADQYPEDERVQPRRDDTLRTYWHRVKHARLTHPDGKGVKSNLDTYCRLKYDFENNFGIKKDELHNGDVDCYAGYRMIEFNRPLIRPPVEHTPQIIARERTEPKLKKPEVRAISAYEPRRYRGQRRN